MSQGPFPTEDADTISRLMARRPGTHPEVRPWLDIRSESW